MRIFIIGFIILVLFKSAVAKSDELEYDKQLDCLSEAIYFEARGELFSGMLAVATVIMNRVDHPSFPSNICDVVHQGIYWKGNPVKNKCQFSYYCDGKPENFSDAYAMQESYKVATFAMEGARLYHLDKALYYHAIYVNPNWPYKKLMVIGQHIFYGAENG